jgi:hypothetical protein
MPGETLRNKDLIEECRSTRSGLRAIEWFSGVRERALLFHRAASRVRTTPEDRSIA